MIPSQRAPFRGPTTYWIIAASVLTVTLWSGSIEHVGGAPAKLDSNATPLPLPLPLELQPPLAADADADVAVTALYNGFSGAPTAIDSYGNPIESLKPIDTPDGRKVVSAQGLQFEIPNYASGITEIKKPADDLLPPFIDPIAVAVPNESAELTAPATGTTSGETTTVDVENAEIVKLPSRQHQLQLGSENSPHIVTASGAATSAIPSYLLELNDPDIGGPVDYMPADDDYRPLIAWDLLPPTHEEPAIITASVPKRVVGVVDPKTNNIKVSLTSGQNFNAQGPSSSATTKGKVSPVEIRTNPSHNLQASNEQPGTAVAASNENIQISLSSNVGQSDDGEHDSRATANNQQRHRGSVYYTSPPTTTPRTTTPRASTTTWTTTTRRPTTTPTPRSTTTRTTTRRPTTTTTPKSTTTSAPYTTTTEPLDTSEYYRLENGDSYTLPSWLADIDDPELDVAVTFVVPTDIHEYNHTIAQDLLPPLEPYVDLNNIHLPAPEQPATTTPRAPSTTTATTRRTTTTTARTTTTTRRPAATPSTTKPHWVRAYPTTTPKPTSLQNRFASNHLAQSHNQPAQSTDTFTNSKASTESIFTTTTTAPQPTISYTHSQGFNVFNQNLPTTTVDPIGSTEDETTESVAQAKPSNPFLPKRKDGQYNSKHHNNGQYNPKPFARNTERPITTTTKTTTTTTTTSTTTTPATPGEENPFESDTLPPWLSQFDYPDLGPGVPFVYDPKDPDAGLGNDLLPPSSLEGQATDTSKAVFVTSSPTSLNSFQSPPQTFTHQLESTASQSGTTTSNSFPSKVTIPLPSIQNKQNDNAVTQPPVLFAPPAATPSAAAAAAAGDDTNYHNGNDEHDVHANPSPNAKTPSSSSNKPFAAPFEPDTPPAKQDPGAFTGATASGGVPTKTTFTKSDDGKVITNNVFLQTAVTGSGQPTTKPSAFINSFATTQKVTDYAHTNTNQFSSSTSGFSSFGSNNIGGAPAGFGSTSFGKTSIPSSFSGFSNVQQTSSFSKGATTSLPFAATSTGGGKYTGGFGGAPGVLGASRPGYAIQKDGTIRDPDHTYRPPTGSTFATPAVAVSTQPPAAAAPVPGFANRVGGGVTAPAHVNANKYHGTFGGPPGVLTPYDNVKQ